MIVRFRVREAKETYIRRKGGKRSKGLAPVLSEDSPPSKEERERRKKRKPKRNLKGIRGDEGREGDGERGEIMESKEKSSSISVSLMFL